MTLGSVARTLVSTTRRDPRRCGNAKARSISAVIRIRPRWSAITTMAILTLATIVVSDRRSSGPRSSRAGVSPRGDAADLARGMPPLEPLGARPSSTLLLHAGRRHLQAAKGLLFADSVPKIPRNRSRTRRAGRASRVKRTSSATVRIAGGSRDQTDSDVRRAFSRVSSQSDA